MLPEIATDLTSFFLIWITVISFCCLTVVTRATNTTWIKVLRVSILVLLQGPNEGLSHCRQILYCLSYQGSLVYFCSISCYFPFSHLILLLGSSLFSSSLAWPELCYLFILRNINKLLFISIIIFYLLSPFLPLLFPSFCWLRVLFVLFFQIILGDGLFEIYLISWGRPLLL